MPGLVGRFGTVNIKLDKCGGLTEGLAMARAAQSLGIEPMVGYADGLLSCPEVLWGNPS
jgi:L-alanine-DL-glutamate epimerase-like enolase superfamily enzyme